MAEAAGHDDEIFVYMGGDQQVPERVRRARIHKSVTIVRARAFYNRRQLISVEFHDGVELIEESAFYECWSLKSPIKLMGVRIKKWAFYSCRGLPDIEFGDKLETIESCVFYGCRSLKKIKMPSVEAVGKLAFADCRELSDVEFGEAMRKLRAHAFRSCNKLKRIVLPLKKRMISVGVFAFCDNLTTVDLTGEIHQTVASLHMDSWRHEMTREINRINQTLPTFTAWHKTGAIQRWIGPVISHLNHYKAEHHQLLKEAAILLELALWKASLSDNKVGEGRGVITGEVESSRDEIRYTSGASIVIKNVLPFLALK